MHKIMMVAVTLTELVQEGKRHKSKQINTSQYKSIQVNTSQYNSKTKTKYNVPASSP